MKIGNVEIPYPAVMAPIAGMTDGPYRRIVLEYGAGMAVTELLSAKALTLSSKATKRMLPAPDEPGPVAVQLFGSDPEVLRDAALIAEAGRADVIDLNFGCPAKKVTRTGGGASLLKDIRLAEKITSAAARAVKKPVTAKIRIGWDFNSVNAVEMTRALEGAGAAAVAIHGRTASQGYGGQADWGVIYRAAEAVKIPVIGNGDITTPETAALRLGQGPCQAVMIGRGALGAPWLFGWIQSFIQTGEYGRISVSQIGALALRHFNMMAGLYGPEPASRKMRGWLGFYSRGLPGASAFRGEINRAHGPEAMAGLIEEFFGAPSDEAQNQERVKVSS